MPVYRRGSRGPEVSRIQARVKELGYYRGPIDADFGGGTEAAVRAFQKAEGLAVDGAVGPDTWARLFPGEEIHYDLAEQCGIRLVPASELRGPARRVARGRAGARRRHR